MRQKNSFIRMNEWIKWNQPIERSTKLKTPNKIKREINRKVNQIGGFHPQIKQIVQHLFVFFFFGFAHIPNWNTNNVIIKT